MNGYKNVPVKTLIKKENCFIVKYRCFNKDHTKTWWVTDRGIEDGTIIKYKTMDEAKRRAFVLAKVERLPFGINDTLVEEYDPAEMRAYVMGFKRGATKGKMQEIDKHRRDNVKKLKTQGKAF